MGPRKCPRLLYCVPSVYTLVDGTRLSVLTVLYTMSMLYVLV